MNNRIRQIDVRDRSAVPAEAEVWITVVPERTTPGTEVRGRLMGPRCPYAGTVEVAYPLRPIPGPREILPGLTRRVVIPEASLWDPESPFLYQGPVELWQDGQTCDRVTLTHGLRTLGLGPRGLRCNGRLLTLRGREVTTCSDDEAMALHRGGCNLLVAPVGPATAGLWDLADRFGFLMLGRLTDVRGEALQTLSRLNAHPSALGWLVPAPGDLRDRLPADFSVGVEPGAEPLQTVPDGVAFVVCAADQVEAVPAGLPVLLRGGEESFAAAQGQTPSPVLGWFQPLAA